MLSADINNSINEYISGLSSPINDVRLKSAVELRKYVESNLKSLTSENYTLYLNNICNELKILLSNSIDSRSGAIYSIASLIDVDFVSIHTHCTEYVKIIKNTRLSANMELLALEARLVGNFGFYMTADYVENQLKSCLECLTSKEPYPESQILFSIHVLQELAIHTPTSFHQFAKYYKDCIFFALFNDRPHIRECAALAFRAGLSVIAEREVSNKKIQESSGLHLSSEEGTGDIYWYKNCLKEVIMVLSETSDKRPHFSNTLNKDGIVHGSLLLLYEILICTNPNCVELLTYLDELAFQPLEEYFCYESAGKSYFPSKNIRTIKWPSSPSSNFLTNLLSDSSSYSSQRSELASGDKFSNYKTKKSEEFSFLNWFSRIRLIYSEKCKLVVTDGLDKIWNDVLLKLIPLASKNPRNTQILMKLIPLVISLRPNAFEENKKRAIEWLFTCITKGREKPFAIFNLALVAHFMPGEFVNREFLKHFYDNLTDLTNKSSSSKQKRNCVQDTAVLMAIILLGMQFDQTYSNILLNLLENIMNSASLSRPLISTCKVLADHMSNLKEQIQDSLLKILRDVVIGCVPSAAKDATSVQYSKISQILSPLLGNQNSVPFFTASAYNNSANVTVNSHSRNLDSIANGSVEITDFREEIHLVSLAINTLGSFNFEGHNMAPLMRYISDHLINIQECQLRELRVEAVRALARLMKPWLRCCEQTNYSQPIIIQSIENIVKKLLTVGTSDPDPVVRQVVFEVLDRDFDEHIAQNTAHLEYLYVALNDEVFEIQCLVLHSLGRLADINPACVQPNLRKMLFQIVSMLDSGGSAHSKDEAALFLAHLISSCPRFFVQYAQPLVYIVIPKIYAILPISLRVYLMFSGVRVLSRLADSENLDNERLFYKPATMMNVALVSSHLALKSICDAVKAIERAKRSFDHQQQNLNCSIKEYRFKPNFRALKDPASSRIFPADDSRSEGDVYQDLRSNLGQFNSDKIYLLKQAVSMAKQAASSAVNASLSSNRALMSTSELALTQKDFNLSQNTSFTSQDQQWLSNALRSINIKSSEFTNLFQRMSMLEANERSLWPQIYAYNENVHYKKNQSAFVQYILNANNVSDFMRIDTQAPRSAVTSSDQFINTSDVKGVLSPGDTPFSAQNAFSEPWAESTRVAVSYFFILGHLTNVAPQSLLPYANDLIPLLTCMLQDPTSYQKRFVSFFYPIEDIAVWLLSKLVTNLGLVVIPYKLEPKLLSILLEMLIKEESKKLRKEVIKLLGLIGALDPFKLKIFTGQIDCVGDTGVPTSIFENSEKTDSESSQWELLVSMAQENEAEFCAISVMNTLVQLLSDPSLSGQYSRVVKTLVYVIHSLDGKATCYLKMFIPQYLSVLRSSKDLSKMMLNSLAALLNIIKIHIKDYLFEIADLLTWLWSPTSGDGVQISCINLLGALNNSLGAEFYPCLEALIPNIVRTLELEKDNNTLIQLLKILPKFSYNLENFVPIIIGPIVQLIDVKNETELLQLIEIIDPKSAVNKTHSKTQQPLKSSNNILDEASVALSSETCEEMTHNILNLKFCAIICLNQLSIQADVSASIGRILHPICRLMNVLISCSNFYYEQTLNGTFKHQVSECARLHIACLKALGQVEYVADSLFATLKAHLKFNTFEIFLPLIEPIKKKILKTFQRASKSIQEQISSNEISKLVESFLATPDTIIEGELMEVLHFNNILKQPFDGENLQRAWTIPEMPSREDWLQWMRTLSAALLRESPNKVLRVVSHNLAGVSPIVHKNLFIPAFLTCFYCLTEKEQDDLIKTFEKVLLETTQPVEVSQMILNLEEFFDHVDKYSLKKQRYRLPLNSNILVDRAKFNRSYAKALYYLERQILGENEKLLPGTVLSEALLTINNKLQLKEAAKGVLMYTIRNSKDRNPNNMEKWYEHLEDWDRALNMYERKLEDQRYKNNESLLLGRMRCLNALGQWHSLQSIASERWNLASKDLRSEMASIAITASWSLGSWEKVAQYVSAIPVENKFFGAFFRAVLAVRQEDLGKAKEFIERARDVLDAELTASARENYSRAYPDLMEAQLLSELEEVIDYHLHPERRFTLQKAWYNRLLGCQSLVHEWNLLLLVRSLVLKPQEQLRSWLKLSGLCRRSNRMLFSRQILESLMPQDSNDGSHEPSISFSYAKWLWASGNPKQRDLAIEKLCTLKDQVLSPLLELLNTVITKNTQKTNSPGTQGIQNPHIGAAMINEIVLSNHVPGSVLLPYIEYPCYSEISKLLLFLSDSTSLNEKLEDYKTLMAKCCLRLGNWYSELYTQTLPGMSSKTPSIISDAFEMFNQAGDSNRTAIRIANQFINQTNQAVNQTPVSNLPNTTHVSVSFSKSDIPWQKAQYMIINCFRMATEMAPNKREAWQAWAMANYAVFNQLDSLKLQLEHAESQLKNNNLQRSTRLVETATQITNQMNSDMKLIQTKAELKRSMEIHASPAVRGFINSIALSPKSNLQDSLRLINLLFKFGYLVDIQNLIRAGLVKIPLENWLLVIQQLLARIDTPKEHVGNIIIDLLIAVGQKHPQAMIYPLVLSFKSGGSDRRRYNANRILYSMEDHCPELVSQAFMLNEELIRSSITWMEMWSECLEDTSRVYFGEKDEAKMFRLLHPLHLVMDRGPETLHEYSFLAEFGKELKNCRSFCEHYERSGASVDLHRAWEGYYALYRNFSKRISSISTLELLVTSPRITQQGSDWQLCVPGSYEPNRPLVRISGFKNCLTFMASKQHPRKLTIIGSDGHKYTFLLKGHEDTRLDERVMQFFGLVNTLLVDNSDTLRMNLTIQRMSVIPLSTNTGLIGWVPNSDTLHSLVRDYREKSGIVLNFEQREILQIAPDFDRLNIIQKTEVFEAALRHYPGRDLAHILWIRSPTAEVWFERRTNFVRSLATMSMVGYILGLGDRHPSNLMLCRETGKVVHIDFGDCFDVAMMREKYPEKVPFRLTRMFVEAMEVSGLDGVYRHTCEGVMSLLRRNRESLLAVLEAFIHDPLLQWVLLENRKDFINLEGKRQGAPNNAISKASLIPPFNQANAGMAQNLQPPSPPTEKNGRHPSGPMNNGNSANNVSIRSSRSGVSSFRSFNGSKKTLEIFINPDYPDSLSLRDFHRVNQWRHHLCNGPWLGSYEKAKKLRTTLESGQVIVVRKGLEGFIFSAKPASQNSQQTVQEDTSTFLMNGNTRARDVMEQIYRKLTGTEKTGRFLLISQTNPANDFGFGQKSRDTFVVTCSPNTLSQNTNGTHYLDKVTIVDAAPKQSNQLDVKAQVDVLIREATSHQNLCQMYIGWCPFW